MVSLEERLRPPVLAAPWPRDLLGMGLLVAIAAVLLPSWSAGSGRWLTDVSGQVTSIYLLPALGFCLALRRGAIDLSVWSCAGLGGMAAAAAHNAGVGIGWAMAAGVAAGLGCGAANGLLVAAWRLPSILVTLATALAIVWAAGSAAAGRRAIALREGAFQRWQFVFSVSPQRADPAGPLQPVEDEGAGRERAAPGAGQAAHGLPLLVTRMVLVAGLFSATLLGLMGFEMAARRGVRVGGGWTTFAALCASGALSAAGGVFWLIDRNAAPIPTRPVDDLRVAAAAVLAGGAYFGGRGRALLAGVCLPPALLVATVWRQEVWDLQKDGYALQMLLLAGMVVVAHAGMAAAVAPRRAGRRWATASAAVTVAGILTLAAGAGVKGYPVRRAFHAGGVLLWIAGVVLLVVGRLRARRARAEQ